MAIADGRDRGDLSPECVIELAAMLRTLPDQLVSIQLDLQPFCRGDVAIPEHVRAALADACTRLHDAVEAVAAIATKINIDR